MNPSDISNFKKALNTILDSFSAKEKFLISPLAVRMSKAAQSNPGDQTIIGLAAYLDKKSGKEFFITRSELNDVYNRLYSNSSRAEQYLDKELGRKEAANPTTTLKHEINENQDFYTKNADQNLVAALSSAFNKDKVVKEYSEELAEKAARVCLRELNKLSFKPKKITTLAGSEEAIICQASYETPKGECGVLVPVEIVDNKALIPSLFVADSGFKEITEASLKNYILATAGIKLQANVQNILQLIKVAKKGYEEPNEVEEIVVRASANRGTPAHSINGIFFTIPEEDKGIVTKADTLESNLFAVKLASESGQADFLFGKEAVAQSRAIILKTAKDAGMVNPQIKVSSFDEKHIYFIASAANGSFKVPVRIENGKVEYPSVAMASGEIETFDREGISKLLAKDDYKLAAQASQFNSTKSSDMLELIAKAAQAGDYTTVEDALNVLDQSGDRVAFASALEYYKNFLSGNIKTASVHKCSMEHKTPNSIHPICGHTNLPVNQVYQDESGQCRPKARQYDNQTSDGASFMNASVYFKA